MCKFAISKDSNIHDMTTETTAKYNARALAHALACASVRNVVLCPGSRNAPLIMAIARDNSFDTRVIIDERSAAFIALGMAIESRRPVAVVCTSGSAILNMAPAVAEAYYRRIPLIAVSADRPEEWIDQDDSQTIRQQGILGNIVKRSCHIRDVSCTGGRPALRQVTRRLADTLIAALSMPQGPVHINVEIAEPLNETSTCGTTPLPGINIMRSEPKATPEVIDNLAETITDTDRVMVVCGFMPPDPVISHALERIAKLDNVVILAESQANVRARGVIYNIDTVLRHATSEMKPGLVLTIGGALVSRHIKKMLRSDDTIRHIHIGIRDMSVDPFMALESRIEACPADVLPRLAESVIPCISDYRSRWQMLAFKATIQSKQYIESSPWSDMVAVYMLIDALDENVHLQVSNGTAIRYVQLCDCHRIGRIESNRGVSGIDGCTSTAIGASMVYEHTTVLLTGDMSAQYDIGALATPGLDGRLKIAVLDNGGGGIFRFITSTRDLPELERYFAADVRLPLEQLADAYGFDYLKADSRKSMSTALRQFTAPSDKPMILHIVTSPDISTKVLRSYFELASNQC